MRRALVLGLSCIAALLGACSFLVPFTDYDRETSAGGDDAGPEAATCPDTMSDPLSCGECGHDCRGSSCLDGLCASQMILPAARSAAKMTLDDGFIYVAYPETGELFRFKKDLSDRAGDRFATGLTGVRQMLVSKDDLFWVHPSMMAGQKVEIGRTSKATGTALERSQVIVDISLVAADDTEVFYVDEFDNFWAVDRSLGQKARGISLGIGDALVDGDRVYAAARTSTDLYAPEDRVLRMDKDGSHKVTLTTGLTNLTTLASDATFLYWSNTGPPTSTIARLPKDAGADSAPESLYTTAEVVYVLKALGDFVYFVTSVAQVDDGPSHGRVWRLPKSGGKALPLTKEIAFTSLGVDATHLYWASDGAIFRSAN